MTALRPPAYGTGEIRRAAVAGTFYPADRFELERLADGLLDLAPPGPTSDPGSPRAASPQRGPPLLGLLVPHAGLSYSGLVAAAAWRLLAEHPAPTVAIAGTNHFDPLAAGVEVWPSGAWQTPLGEQPLDEELAGAVLGLGPPFRIERAAHLAEHSIEAQLPLLRRANPRASLVPFLVSLPDRAECSAAGTRLGRLLGAWRAAGRDIVLVASSDLVHYPAAEVAERLDRALLQPLLALDGPGLAHLEAALVGSEPGLACGLCGIEPVLLVLAALRAMGARPGDLLAASTSAAAPGGDPRRTVGYAAVAFRGPSEGPALSSGR